MRIGGWHRTARGIVRRGTLARNAAAGVNLRIPIARHPLAIPSVTDTTRYSPAPVGDEASAAPAGAGFDRLPRSLGVWSAAAVLVGSTIGSGIFRVPGAVAARVGTVGAVTLLWLVGALVALVGALTIAELAGLFPRSGGIYVFIREGFGPLPAFLFGWTELLVIRPSAIGAIAVLFAEYTVRLFHFDPSATRWIAAASVLVIGLANIRSVGWGAVVQNASTAAKTLALVGLALVGFLLGSGADGALSQPIAWSPTSWGGFGLALVSVMWAYDGWADLTFMAGEVKDPDRTLPRALLGGVLAIVAIYLAVNAVYLYLLPMPVMTSSKLVAADTAQRIFGATGESVVSAMVMMSALGALNGSMMTGPRIFYAMAEDGLFFRPVAAVHPRFRTPYLAIALAMVLGIGYLSVQSFEKLADDFILGIWPFYALAVAAVFVLRRRRPDLPRPYRTAGYPITPVIFLLASLGMLANAIADDPKKGALGAGLILLGIPVFFLWKRRRA
jgi:amino acid transporter